jgi:hypothetical protein
VNVGEGKGIRSVALPPAGFIAGVVAVGLRRDHLAGKKLLDGLVARTRQWRRAGDEAFVGADDS